MSFCIKITLNGYQYIKIINSCNLDRYCFAIFKMFCLIRKHDLLLSDRFPLLVLLLADLCPHHSQAHLILH